MKKFIIISLLTVVSLPMLACAGIGTFNYYLFNLYDNDDFAYRMERITTNNWKVYMGLGEDDWFWFSEDKVTEVAKQKNDALMQSYVHQLARYLNVCSDVQGDQWNYPTKEELAKRRTTLEAIRAYANTKLRTRLRSQHGLLYMRANMLLGNHAENVKFWEETASQYINSVYKDMMQNIYAGALYKTGRTEDGVNIFVEQGDYRSLMTIYYKRRSYVAINEVYNANPKARVLPFLLQDFVNNAQEADDAVKYDGFGGKLFIRDITKAEAQQMIGLCKRAVSEQKTDVPAMWQTAQALLEFMFGDKKQAQADIQKAVTMEGSERMKDCARVIRLYIEGYQRKQNSDFDNWAGSEMQWLYNKGNRANPRPVTNYYERSSYYDNAFDRIVQQVMADKYKTVCPEVTVALYKVQEFGGYYTYLDTTTIANVQQYKAYLTAAPKTEMDRFLKNAIRQQPQQDEANAENEYNDLIGTKYLRLCQWDKAIEWLSKVPVAFYQNKGYSLYAALRRTNVEPWIERQFLRDAEYYSEGARRLRENPKLVFAKQMQQLEYGMNMLQDKSRYQRCYDLAVRYAQANFSGDCWFIMRDAKSPGCDEVEPNEVDLAARALDYLREAAKTTDPQLKERALFALSYGELQPKGLWCSMEWNSDKAEFDRVPQRKNSQWKAFASLVEFERQNPAGTARYVSRCDEYDTFLNAYNKK